MYGNELFAKGAMESGLDFYAAYPMTPASSVIDEVVKNKEVIFFQGEDEIAVSMAMLGAKFAGKEQCVELVEEDLPLCLNLFLSQIKLKLVEYISSLKEMVQVQERRPLLGREILIMHSMRALEIPNRLYSTHQHLKRPTPLLGKH